MCNIIYNFLVDSFWLISIRWLLTNLFAWNFAIFPHTVSFGKKIVDNGVNDIRIVGAVTLAVLIVICAIGMEWETKAQNFLIAIIVAAIFNFIIGAIMGPPSQDAAAQGFTGFNRKFRKTERRNLFTKKMFHNFGIFPVEVFNSNMGPNYRMSEGIDQTFFSVFAIFFPSGN